MSAPLDLDALDALCEAATLPAPCDYTRCRCVAAMPALAAELREARADLATVSATSQRGCDCTDDEACRFARERDEARAEAERLRGLLYGREVYVHGPDGVPHPGCPVCDALAPRVAP